MRLPLVDIPPIRRTVRANVNPLGVLLVAAIAGIARAEEVPLAPESPPSDLATPSRHRLAVHAGVTRQRGVPYADANEQIPFESVYRGAPAGSAFALTYGYALRRHLELGFELGYARAVFPGDHTIDPVNPGPVTPATYAASMIAPQLVVRPFTRVGRRQRAELAGVVRLGWAFVFFPAPSDGLHGRNNDGVWVALGLDARVWLHERFALSLGAESVSARLRQSTQTFGREEETWILGYAGRAGIVVALGGDR